MRSVPSRAIKDQKGVDVTAEVLGEVREIRFHDFAVHPGKKAGVGISGGWANRAKQVDPLVFGLSECSGTAAALSPYAGQRALLAEARLVLEPKVYPFARCQDMDFMDCVGESFF